jgi:type IV pilus biogenesis protein CpaD/CtpE
MRRSGVSAFCCVVLAALSLGACTMTTPSEVTTSQIQVEDYMKTTLLPLPGVNATSVDLAANDYRRNGKSPAELVVPYLKGKKNSLAGARRSGTAYRKAFEEFGMGLQVKYAETTDKDSMHNAVLSYTAALARAPKHCKRMPGAKGAEIQENTSDYSFGCEHSILLSKMISRPEDLMGVAGTPDSLSRREAPMMEGYMSGRTSPGITGLTSSGGVVSGGGTSGGQPTSQ